MAPPPVPALFEHLARGWRAYVLIAAIALAGALPGVGRMPVMDRDEARFVQATRQMLETGDYVRIRIQTQDRNKKPIGIHWLQAAAVDAAFPITGRLNEIWPYRLPSVLAAVLAGLATFWAGLALMSRRAAFFGAALFSAGALMGFEAMTAKTDAMMVALTTIAMAAAARLYAAPKRPKLYALIFWAALGAGVLVKGPVTPIVVGLSLIALSLWERRVAWMRPLLWWAGPILGALIVAPWMIAIGEATHGGFFAAMLGGDIAPKMAGGQEGHAAPAGYHTLLLAALIFPAAFTLPPTARLAWRIVRTPHEEPAPLRFLLAWALPTFLAFELLPTKLPHYTLPTYPAFALLGGAAAFAAVRERWRIANGLGLVTFALGGAALVGLLAYGASYLPGDADANLRREIQAGLVGAGVLIAALVVLALFKHQFVRASAAILCALSLSYALREHVLPQARWLHVSAEAAAALTRTRLTPTSTRPLWVVGYRETSLVFLTRTDIHLSTPHEAGGAAKLGDALLVESRVLPQTETELALRGLVFSRKGGPVMGLNYGNGDIITLYAGDVEEPPEP